MTLLLSVVGDSTTQYTPTAIQKQCTACAAYWSYEIILRLEKNRVTRKAKRTTFFRFQQPCNFDDTQAFHQFQTLKSGFTHTMGLIAPEQAWPTRGSRAACGYLLYFMRLSRKYSIHSCISPKILYQLFTLKFRVRLTHALRVISLGGLRKHIHTRAIFRGTRVSYGVEWKRALCFAQEHTQAITYTRHTFACICMRG